NGFVLTLPVFDRHEDGDGNVIGISADDMAQAQAIQILRRVLAQMQDHFGTALLTLFRGDGVAAAAVGLPAYAMRRLYTGPASQQGNFVGNDESRVKAHAELTDQLRVLSLIASQRVQELACAGAG